MKQLESQLLELRMRVDEQSRLSQDLGLNKSRLLSENTEFTRQVEELDAQMTQTAHLKTHFIAQLVTFFKVKSNKIRGKAVGAIGRLCNWSTRQLIDDNWPTDIIGRREKI